MRKENTVLAGLWIGPTKPNPELFLSVFENDLKNLCKGIQIQLPHKVINVRGMIISGTCDLPAKATFVNMTNHSSRNGCSNCEIETIKFENTATYPFKETMNLRTTDETKSQARQAYENKEVVCGIKGPSFLSLITFNYMISLIVDIMHCVHQGVVKNLMGFWFGVALRTHPVSLFPYISLINERIKRLRLPSFIQRIPRDVSDFTYWKASKLKVFLLFSLVILDGLLEPKYLEHHSLLVRGIFLLNSRVVSDEDVEKSQKLLDEYVLRFGFLYGKKYTTLVLHLLRHLPKDVKEFGPPWATSCFPFKNSNGVLSRYVHGSKNPELQICSSVTSFLAFEDLKKENLQPGSEVAQFCNKMGKSGTHRRKTKCISQNVFALGARQKCSSLPEKFSNILSEHNISVNGNQVHLIHEILKGNIYIETSSYAKKKKTNFSCIEFVSNGTVRFGFVDQFITVCRCGCTNKCEECNELCKTHVIVSECSTDLAFFCNFSQSFIPNIFKCTETNIVHVVDVQDILGVCFAIDVEDKSYIIKPLNDEEVE
ncbi:hypothetical protein QAD02_000528 [Eretmocerus hayati]|uniref:Uncharacterized protein n=1 Tax=Eretmocerus hayati TaxID=131215 RepID=A0ACC2NDX3_9HYME|nr:hypothetical protein QAD02_000528 [Eretmocerus hayati]